jgi:hypothetical protein
MREALDAIGDVQDALQRQVLQSRLADAVRGVVPKKVLVNELEDRRREREQKQEEFAIGNRQAELQRLPLHLPELIHDAEMFYDERASLPDGAALVLAYFSLNSYVFDVFDTTPYGCLESATKQCGKTTVAGLVAAISRNGLIVNSPTEAIFRLIDKEHPTLCLDEAEILEGKTDRAAELRAIFHQGYKRGGLVPRCVRDEHEVRFFDAYCPKLFAAIGGLSGPMLDRCFVIHMEKAPRGSKRKSVKTRSIACHKKPLVEKFEAYAVQYREKLQELYDSEPDDGYWATQQILDREAELWGPLLIHARLIGHSAEERFLKVIEGFRQAKDRIQSEDPHTSKAVALLEVLGNLKCETFCPAELVESLSSSDAWANTFAKAKGMDDATRGRTKAAAVGYVLRNYRLKRVGKSGSGSSLYSVKDAIAVIGKHVPENLPFVPEVQQPDLPYPQVTEKPSEKKHTEATEAFDEGEPEMDGGDRVADGPIRCYVHGFHSEFWERETGGWVCGRCHPPAEGHTNSDGDPPAGAPFC